MTDKRTKYEIRAEMLRAAKGGCNKTRLVYNAYLNFDIVNPHLTALIDNGLLVRQGKRYLTTNSGLEYIGHVDAITTKCDNTVLYS
jgi:predicted transcriptional regulator